MKTMGRYRNETELEYLARVMPTKASLNGAWGDYKRGLESIRNNVRYENCTLGPVTLPKLKFLEGKDP